MAITVNDLVSPTAPAVAAPPTPEGKAQPGFLQEPLTPTDESKAQIPDAVLQIPTFRAVLEGKPPALSTKGSEQDPDMQVIKENVEPLLYSGFGFYQAKDGVTQVLYNSQFIDGNAIKLADDKGRLDDIAAPYGELKSFFTEGLAEEGVPAAGVAPDVSAVPQSAPMGAPAPASTQTQLANARINNLQTGSPTSGPSPGSGRVLNNILKTPV